MTLNIGERKMTGMYRVGVDLGGTNIKVGILDANDNLVGKMSGKTDPYNRTWQEVVADIAALIGRLLSKNDIPVSACAKVGVGSPGMIDPKTGTVVFAGNFNWVNVPLLNALQTYFDLPLKIANDADCAVLGEVVAGAAKGSQCVVMLTLGTGVGGGVIIDKKPQAGGPGNMEYGHMIMCYEGEKCTCGQRGCVEAYASATALIRDAKRAAENDRNSKLWELCGGNLQNMDGKIPFVAAREGDDSAKVVVEQYVCYVGVAIINAVNIWRPEKVLLGGGIAHEGESFIRSVENYVHPRVFAGERGFIPAIARATLGNDAGLYGAAALL